MNVNIDNWYDLSKKIKYMYNSPQRSLLKESGEILKLNMLSIALQSFQESLEDIMKKKRREILLTQLMNILIQKRTQKKRNLMIRSDKYYKQYAEM